MRVFVAGGTGVIGRRLLPLLLEAGHDVTALARSAAGEEAVRAMGATAAVADALDAPALRSSVLDAKPEVVVNQLTNLPRRIDPRRTKQAMATTDRLRIEATGTLVAAAEAAGARRLVSQSISFVYRPDGTSLATEDEPLYLDAPESFRHLIEAVHESERQVLAADGVEGLVLRYGYFYGPGSSYAPGGSFTEDVMHHRVPVVGDGRGVCSFVHVDDAASATVKALDHGDAGVYNVVDDDPAPVATWLPFFAELLGAKPPRQVPKILGRLAAGRYGVYFMTRQRGASNRKAKAELRWQPRYPSWRDGFRGELQGGDR